MKMRLILIFLLCFGIVWPAFGSFSYKLVESDEWTSKKDFNELCAQKERIRFMRFKSEYLLRFRFPENCFISDFVN